MRKYGHGNRSSWLRQALDLFEHRELADMFVRIAAAGEQGTAARGLGQQQLRRLLADQLASPDGRVVAEAERVVADLATDRPDPGEQPSDSELSPAARRFFDSL